MSLTAPTALDIVRLPQQVADAIAAGEVVERPASVVKELCENALDAGARRVDVQIEGGGTVRIRVVDDGCGIAPTQLTLAAARHATSKIRAVDDLDAIRTMGFRGEALASIAAVSDLRIASTTAGATAGAELHVRNGVEVSGGSASPVPGTTVTVCDLFAATPGRLRFLRQPKSEAAAGVRVVSELALCHPEVAFSCENDGRRVVASEGTGDLRDAAAAVFGREAAHELLAIEAGGAIAVSGLISEPRAHRGTRGNLVVVVNRRRVHNRSLVFAIEEAYRGLVPQGRHPYGVVNVTISPAEIDVNVHPAKREIRFREESRVFGAVQKACWEALQSAHVATIASPWGGAEPVPGMALTFGDNGGHDRATTLGASRFPEPGFGNATSPAADSTLAELAPLTALGQRGGEWIVAASAAGLVVVDPHAAHEKIIYTELLASMLASSAGKSSQLLLIPTALECDPAGLLLIAEHADLLEQMGFVVEPFGPTTLRCTAVPASAANADVDQLVRDLVDGLGERGPVSARNHRVAALVACHSAVRFGDSLGAAEQQRLLDQLTATPEALTCPHGRPTVVVLDDASLRRLFRRPPV